MAYKYGTGSRKLMEGVKPKLVATADRAIGYNILDLTIIGPYGGLRDEKIQRHLVDIGASKTMNSRHRKQSDGYGHALDIAPYPIDWNDINSIDGFVTVAHLMRFAAIEEGVLLTWGAVWDRPLNALGPNLKAEVDAYVKRRRARGRKAFLDYPHFQYEGEL